MTAAFMDASLSYNATSNTQFDALDKHMALGVDNYDLEKKEGTFISISNDDTLMSCYALNIG